MFSPSLKYMFPLWPHGLEILTHIRFPNTPILNWSLDSHVMPCLSPFKILTLYISCSNTLLGLFALHCRTLCNLLHICIFFTFNHLLLWLFFNQALAFKRILGTLGWALSEGIMWDVHPWASRNRPTHHQVCTPLGGGFLASLNTGQMLHFLDESLNLLPFLGIHRGASMTKNLTSTELKGITFST